MFIIAGLNFWKTPSRKIYAVPLGRSYDSDEDFEPPVTKKGKKQPVHNISETVLNSISAIQGRLDDVMSVTKDSKLPLGMKKAMYYGFKCSICTAIMKPPIIFTKCCKTLLGCEPCVNSWFSGEDALTKSCPKCRAKRGYNETTILRGLDPVLEMLSKLDGEVTAENE